MSSNVSLRVKVIVPEPRMIKVTLRCRMCGSGDITVRKVSRYYGYADVWWRCEDCGNDHYRSFQT